jgi:putative DNA primase/helicase
MTVAEYRPTGNYSSGYREEDIVSATKGDAWRINGCMGVLGSYCDVDISEFDNDPDVINVANGVLHLPSGTLSTHSYAHRFTYCLPTEFKPEGDFQEWVNYLSGTVEGSEEAVNFLQEWVGYCLTGHTREEKMLYASTVYVS